MEARPTLLSVSRFSTVHICREEGRASGLGSLHRQPWVQFPSGRDGQLHLPRLEPPQHTEEQAPQFRYGMITSTKTFWLLSIRESQLLESWSLPCHVEHYDWFVSEYPQFHTDYSQTQRPYPSRNDFRFFAFVEISKWNYKIVHMPWSRQGTYRLTITISWIPGLNSTTFIWNIVFASRLGSEAGRWAATQQLHVRSV